MLIKLFIFCVCCFISNFSFGQLNSEYGLVLGIGVSQIHNKFDYEESRNFESRFYPNLSTLIGITSKIDLYKSFSFNTGIISETKGYTSHNYHDFGIVKGFLTEKTTFYDFQIPILIEYRISNNQGFFLSSGMTFSYLLHVSKQSENPTSFEFTRSNYTKQTKMIRNPFSQAFNFNFGYLFPINNKVSISSGFRFNINLFTLDSKEKISPTTFSTFQYVTRILLINTKSIN